MITVKSNTIVSRIKTYKKSSLIIAVKLIISAGLLFYLINTLEYDQIILALKNVNILLLGLVVFLSVFNIYFQYAKWKLTCREVLSETDKSKVFRSLFYGFSAGIITPLRVGEYFGRGIEFKDKSLLQVTIATLVDKFFPLLIVVFFGSVSSLIYIYYYYNVSEHLILSLFILLFTLFYLFFFIIKSKKFWNSVIFSKINSSESIKTFFDKLKIFENLDKKYFNKMSLISILFYLCYLVQYVFLVSAFSGHFDLLSYFWAANLIMFVKTMIPPISIGELGIREGASVYFLTQMGESASVGFNSSIMLFIINLLVPALIGAVMFLRKNGN